jgi:CDGSH-type Zn-finger protein/uncharacterized Fe-S cluster protein YjdI
MSDDITRYPGSDVDVTWDGRLCIHVGECGRASGELFVGGRKPWCQPDAGGEAEAVQEVVRRCPTGALFAHRADGAATEQADAENVVVVSNNGPLYVRGDLAVDGAADDMPGVRFRAALCRCGLSKNKPFCDNSHEAGGFVDRGAVGDTGPGTDGATGELKVSRAPNGPLLLSGPFVIVAASGQRRWSGTKAALCRCGQSKNKPFCDGSHRTAGFQAD